MTGGDAIKLARKALTWARYELARQAARAAELEASRVDAASEAFDAVYDEYRSAAARAGGYRRGLLNEARRILAKGHDGETHAKHDGGIDLDGGPGRDSV